MHVSEPVLYQRMVQVYGVILPWTEDQEEGEVFVSMDVLHEINDALGTFEYPEDRLSAVQLLALEQADLIDRKPDGIWRTDAMRGFLLALEEQRHGPRL